MFDIVAYQRKYRQEHKEESREYERIRALRKKGLLPFPPPRTKTFDRKAWTRAYNKARYHANPARHIKLVLAYKKTARGAAIARHSSRTYAYLKKNAAGTHTLDEWLHLKASNAYLCVNCGNMEPFIKLTEDHIVPLSKGGDNFISNIQPLCRSCNSSKGNKM